MIRRTIMTAVAFLALSAAPALADTRLKSHVYDPDEVVRIDGKLGVQATIAFGDSEGIENVAVGDSQEWQITPNKRANLLFVKPLAAAARTNMTVVTNKRTYFFDLVASAKASPLYMLRFTYADEPETPAMPDEPDLAALNPDERAAISDDPIARPADQAELNFAWRQKGDAALMPSRIYDDGKSTFLSWSKDQPVPAILVRNKQGEEGPVNYAVRGSTIVIDDVPSLIVLRTGDASATLENLRRPADSANLSEVPAFAPYRPVKPYFAALSALPFASSTWRN